MRGRISLDVLGERRQPKILKLVKAKYRDFGPPPGRGVSEGGGRDRYQQGNSAAVTDRGRVVAGETGRQSACPAATTVLLRGVGTVGHLRTRPAGAFEQNFAGPTLANVEHEAAQRPLGLIPAAAPQFSPLRFCGVLLIAGALLGGRDMDRTTQSA